VKKNTTLLSILETISAVSFKHDHNLYGRHSRRGSDRSTYLEYAAVDFGGVNN
jgi:hypothetical protein